MTHKHSMEQSREKRQAEQDRRDLHQVLYEGLANPGKVIQTGKYIGMVSAKDDTK